MSNKRDELENTAIEKVQTSGFNNLSFRLLADEVGIKSSSVHYYFPEKSHLASALIKKYSDNFFSLLASIKNSSDSPSQKIQAFIDIFDTVSKEDKFCLCGMLAAEISVMNDHCKHALIDYFQQVEDWITSVIQEEEFTLKLTAKTFARILISGLEGALLIDRVETQKKHIQAQRELIQQIIG